MKICVLGAGSMGGTYGGKLAEAGEDVLLVDTWEEHVRAINAGGLRLDGVGGERRIKVPAATSAAGKGPFDAVIVYVDTNNTAAVAPQIGALLAPGGYAISLQNGIGNVETLVAALGRDKVMGGLSYHSAQAKGPGHVTHTHKGQTWLGELDGKRTDRVVRLDAAMRKADLVPEIVDNIDAVIWTKFLLNCSINAICAVTGLRQGEIGHTPALDEFQDHIVEEALAVVAARKMTLADPDIRATIKKQCFTKFNKPSMLQHVEAGKRTEIDAINGALVREGQRLGVPTPFNEALSLLIKGREKAAQQEKLATPIDYDAFEANVKREYEASGLPKRG